MRWTTYSPVLHCDNLSEPQGIIFSFLTAIDVSQLRESLAQLSILSLHRIVLYLFYHSRHYIQLTIAEIDLIHHISQIR